jgi:hypothetical protein
MHETAPLTPEERQWLEAIDREPMTRAAADAIPERTRQSLIDRQLVHWKVGYLEVALLETTDRGANEVARKRGKGAQG